MIIPLQFYPVYLSFRHTVNVLVSDKHVHKPYLLNIILKFFVMCTEIKHWRTFFNFCALSLNTYAVEYVLKNSKAFNVLKKYALRFQDIELASATQKQTGQFPNIMCNVMFVRLKFLRKFLMLFVM